MLIQLKKLKKSLINDGKAARYFLYAIGEICLVVIGILIALQFNNINIAKQHRQIEHQYYQTMKEQLAEDRRFLQYEMHGAMERKEAYSFAKLLIKSNDRNRMAELGPKALRLIEYGDFRRKSNVFQTLIYSGEIKYIENKAIIGILQELERIYEITERLEKIQADMVMTHSAPAVFEIIDIETAMIVSPDLVFSQFFINLFPLATRIIDEKMTLFEDAIGQIDAALAEIDGELTATN